MIDCGKHIFRKEEQGLHIRMIDCGNSIEFSQFYMALVTHNCTEVYWTTGEERKRKKTRRRNFLSNKYWWHYFRNECVKQAQHAERRAINFTIREQCRNIG